MRIRQIFKKTAILLVGVAISIPAIADHSWGPPYHWASTDSPFSLTVINSTTSDWDSYVSQSISDWSVSSKLTMVEDINGGTSKKVRRQCKGGTGTVRICNLAYGNTGWLGIAGISIDSRNHITTGYTKLNDTYFADPFYDEVWKQSVTCQELGHDVGLGHQDENFNSTTSLFTCMDYQNPPYEYPNAHDYEQLGLIYDHKDSYSTVASGGGGGGGGCKAPPGKGCNAGATGNNRDIGWGASLGRRGNAETFIRIDADGTMHLTHVTWAIGF